MKKQDFISILITFCVGAVGGGYLYLTSVAFFESKLTVPDAEEISEFTLVSDVYGGCRDTCPSFQVINDGTYRYLYTPSAGAEQIIRQGTLPVPLQRSLKNSLILSELEAQSRSIQPPICNSYTDGIDVVYEITLNGKQYIIDSCGTAVKSNGQLWLTLNSVWDYFENL